jgi:hypothetical protein
LLEGVGRGLHIRHTIQDGRIGDHVLARDRGRE